MGLARYSYTYDFGDNWEHRILLEKILPRDKTVRYPICLKGKDTLILPEESYTVDVADDVVTFTNSEYV